MSKKSSRSWFDIAIDLVDELIKKGYVQAWFSWLGWVTMSSIIYVLGNHAQSFIVQFLGGLSLGVTLIAGLVGVEKIRDDWLEVNRGKTSYCKSLVVVLSIAALGVYVVFEIIGVVFKVTLNTNGLS